MDTNLDRRQREIDLDAQLGSHLARLRERAGLKQEDVALQLGFTRTVISKLEHGQRKLYAMEIPDYARALQVSPSVLFSTIERISTEYDSSK
ncbi:MAG: helix-turn-helix transcriptional regulator [Atopobiaceae bacterium]|nr:helix-turn-helix transcriptional regulator [Atopobiaceae bacterium]